jgi:hypothetical protein
MSTASHLQANSEISIPNQARPGRCGAATGAMVHCGMQLIPATLGIIESPIQIWWLPVILLALIPGTVISAVLGMFIGRLAHRAANSAVGAGLGAGVSIPVGLVAAFLFVEAVEPRDNFVAAIVLIAVPGTCAGAIVPFFVREAGSGRRWPQPAMTDCAVFSVLLAVAGVWFGHRFFESRAQSRIAALGGSVTWNATVDRRGVWQVTLQGDQIGDSEIEGLIPILTRYTPLDLDLGHSQVTSASLPRLKTLSNLIRIRLYGTAVSEAEIAMLKHDMPRVEVLRVFSGH